MAPTRLFALGGMLEIGKTAIVVEHEEEIIILDAGIKFANGAETGVDGLIPDYSYLAARQEKIQGLFITHGHEDHIGGVPYLIQAANIKIIFAPKIAIEFIKDRLMEFKGIHIPKFVEIDADSNFKFKHFELDFWTSQHSIPDSFGIRVKTPNGTIFDTGDFRFDYTPIGDIHTDFTKLEKFAQEGVDVMISDSTNAMQASHSPSEQRLTADIEKCIQSAKGKVVLTTFGSNLVRLKMVIALAIKNKRKVLILGRSMVRATNLGIKHGYIAFEGVDLTKEIVDKTTLSKYEDKDLLIITTGSQGEEMAALTKMSHGKHPQVRLKDKDIVIFSSSPIPGNRIKIELLINNLYRLGVEAKENIIDGMLHASGHAYKDEHMKIFGIVKPHYFIPYHGAYRQSAVHGYSAVASGVKPENIVIIKNGDVVELREGKVVVTPETIDPGPIYVDSNLASAENYKVIKVREALGANGFIHVVAYIDRNRNQIIGSTKIISRGAIYIKDSQTLMNEIQKLAHGTILHVIKNRKNYTKRDIKNLVKERIEPFFYQRKRRTPLVVTSILERGGNPDEQLAQGNFNE